MLSFLWLIGLSEAEAEYLRDIDYKTCPIINFWLRMEGSSVHLKESYKALGSETDSPLQCSLKKQFVVCIVLMVHRHKSI